VPPSTVDTDSHVESLAAFAVGSPEDALTTKAAAAILNVSTQWLEKGRHEGYGPPYIRLSPKLVRYVRGQLAAWVAAQQVHTCVREYQEYQPGHSPGRPRSRRRRRRA
jgi:hypothetical protein